MSLRNQEQQFVNNRKVLSYIDDTKRYETIAWENNFMQAAPIFEYAFLFDKTTCALDEENIYRKWERKSEREISTRAMRC